MPTSFVGVMLVAMLAPSPVCRNAADAAELVSDATLGAEPPRARLFDRRLKGVVGIVTHRIWPRDSAVNEAAEGALANSAASRSDGSCPDKDVNPEQLRNTCHARNTAHPRRPMAALSEFH